MLRALKLIVPALVLISIWIYLTDQGDNRRTESNCKWPPSRPPDVSESAPFNITICARPFRSLTHQTVVKYYLSDLFKLPPHFPNRQVTFDDLASLPDSLWNLAKYPDIYSTYPQHVPIVDLVRKIKRGQQVSHVSFPIRSIFMLFLFLCLYCLLYRR